VSDITLQNKNKLRTQEFEQTHKKRIRPNYALPNKVGYM